MVFNGTLSLNPGHVRQETRYEDFEKFSFSILKLVRCECIQKLFLLKFPTTLLLESEYVVCLCFFHLDPTQNDVLVTLRCLHFIFLLREIYLRADASFPL